VAVFLGDAWVIDGQNVILMGTRFEVAPGCHVVTAPTHSRGVASTAAVAVDPEHVSFALPMKARHRYAMHKAEFVSGDQDTKAQVFQVTEKDPNGSVTGTFDVMKGSSDFSACSSAGLQPPSGAMPPRAPSDGGDAPEKQGGALSKSPPVSWQDPPLTRWQDALLAYRAQVNPGNQRVMGPARVDMGKYLVGVHNRIHVIFADRYLHWLDSLPIKNDPRNDPSLNVRLEIVLSGKDGRIVRMGVVRSSGVPSFDAAALEAVDQAIPFGEPPASILSTDGNLYFHWEFHRDPAFACSTINARPFILAIESPSPAR
jgi:TonB family protein